MPQSEELFPGMGGACGHPGVWAGPDGRCQHPAHQATPQAVRAARGGPSGRGAPRTSTTAGRTVASGSQRAQVLLALLQHGPMTGHELSRLGLVLNAERYAVSPNQVCTRLQELREAFDPPLVTKLMDRGHVVTRTTTGANSAEVHTLTAAGQRVAEGLRG